MNNEYISANELEIKFLEVVNSLEQLTPKDVSLVGNDVCKDTVQYDLTITDCVFNITIEKNSDSILSLGYGNEVCAVNKNSELLYEELKKKARVWYRNADLSDYTVTYNKQKCNIYLDLFSFIQPFVLKPVYDEDVCYLGLDFLTIYGLINNKGVSE